MLDIRAGHFAEIPVRGNTFVTYIDTSPGPCVGCKRDGTLRVLMLEGVLIICRMCGLFVYKNAVIAEMAAERLNAALQ